MEAAAVGDLIDGAAGTGLRLTIGGWIGVAAGEMGGAGSRC
jgi:hypothetical protein